MNLPDDSANIAFKLKEVSKRASQLGFIALFVSLGITLYFSFLGLYLSSVMIGVFSVTIATMLLLQLKKIVKNIQHYVIGLANALLITSAFVEGSQTGQYFYFFPLIMTVPIVIDFKKSSFRYLTFHFILILLSFALCFYAGHTVRPFEVISDEVASKMLYMNAGCAMFLTLLFSLAYILYERNYIKAITKEKNRAITSRTKFLSTMGHELRTPLNGIIGAMSILKDEMPSFEQNEYFQILKHCSQHMQQLVNDILDFNKIEAGKLDIHPVEVNLKQLLVNATLPFYNPVEEKNLKLIVNIDPELDITVLIDDVRLIQILNNLISNALKFTEKGFIKLDVVCDRIDELIIEVGFSVEDTGIGIEKEHQKKIFESFWQVYDKNTRNLIGTGLGLTICIRLLELMNSSLELVSEKGAGSTFSFDLTLTRSENPEEHIEGPANDNEDLSGCRILIVEDNQINMIIARKLLTGFNAECTPAYNGKEALDILAQDQAYDIIVMDLEMPVMNGYTAIVEMKKLYPGLPVVAFTASLIDQQMLSDLIASGFADCISKPFQPHQLFSQIKKYAKEPHPVNS